MQHARTGESLGDGAAAVGGGLGQGGSVHSGLGGVAAGQRVGNGLAGSLWWGGEGGGGECIAGGRGK